MSNIRQNRQKQLRLTPREKLLFLLLLLVLLFGLVQAVYARMEPDRNQVPTYHPPGMQPFEDGQDNFPGSAFYYLDDNSQYFSPTAVSDSQGGYGGANQIARSFSLRGTLQDRNRALQCLSDAIYYEAGLEPDAGQQAVAQVILNRVMHPSYPDTVCGVVYQGSERWRSCQFTFSCDGSMTRKPSATFWQRARRTAEKALSGYVYAPAGMATHYHTIEVHPYWAPSLDFLGTIGAHRFYRWKGKAGYKAAFNEIYAGGEPLPAPKIFHSRSGPAGQYASKAPSAPDPLDPLVLAKAYEATHLESAGSASQAPSANTGPVSHGFDSKSGGYAPPVYSEEAKARGGEKAFGGENLPDASGIQPEYRSSGKWKKLPGQ